MYVMCGNMNNGDYVERLSTSILLISKISTLQITDTSYRFKWKH